MASIPSVPRLAPRSRSSSEASIRMTSVGFRPRFPKVWRLANRSVRNIACHSRTGRIGGWSRRAAAYCLLTVNPFGSRASASTSPTEKAEIRREALVRLTDDIRDLDNPQDLAFAASTILGETLHVSRASYGTIDPDAETLTVDRDWLAPGVELLVGTLNLRDYGSSSTASSGASSSPSPTSTKMKGRFPPLKR